MLNASGMGSLCFYEQNNLLDSQKWLWLILEHKTADPSVYLNIAKCWAEIQLALWGSSSSFSLGCEARNGWGAFLLRRLYQIGWGGVGGVHLLGTHPAHLKTFARCSSPRDQTEAELRFRPWATQTLWKDSLQPCWASHPRHTGHWDTPEADYEATIQRWRVPKAGTNAVRIQHW